MCLTKDSFLLNTITAWNEPPRSRHQVAKALLKHGEVYFITRNETGLPKIEQMEHEGINYLIPTWPLDYRFRYRLPVQNELYQQFIYYKLKKLSLENELLINFDHTAQLLTKKFKKSVYYCSDQHIGNSNIDLWLVNKYHLKTEYSVAKNSSFCITTSEYLKNKLRPVNDKTYLIPLGSPEIDYSRYSYYKSSLNESVKVCYVGFMGSRKTDFDIIKSIIKDDRLKLYIIGNVDLQFQDAINKKSEYLGIKKGHELYSSLEKMDVCIIPYDINGINDGVTPNKYWLYTAMGKPVVTVDFDNIKNWPRVNGLLYATDKMHFKDFIFKAHNENDREKYLKRIQHAKENTWNKRIEQFITILKNNA